MTRRHKPRSPYRRRPRRTGVALLLVLIAAVVAFTIASALLTSQATTITIAQNATDLAQARFVAESGLRITAAYVQRSATWRSDRTSGAWASNVACAPGAFSVAGYDGADANGDGVISQPSEGDGSLADDSSDLLTLVVTGAVNGATHIARAVITPGGMPAPAHQWKLDETSGSTAVNSVSSINGTLTNFTTSNSKWTTGQIDGALTFDETDDYIALPNFPNLTGSFTITAWIRPNNVNGDQRIFCDDRDNASGYAFSLGDSGGSGQLRFFSRTLNPVWLDSSAVVTAGTWQHVACVNDSAARIRRIYHNAAVVAADSSPYTGAWGTDAGDATIGGELNGSSEGNSQYRFGGRIDDVRVYDVALTATQIAAVRDGNDGSTASAPPAAVTAITSGTTGYSHPAAAGVNRLLVVVVGMEDTYSRTVSAITYGGQPLTQITTAAAGGNSGNPYDRVCLYYLNEAGIAAASGSTISVAWSGSVDDSYVAAAMFANVDQANPIRAFVALDVDTSTPNPIVAPALTVAANDMVVAAAICGNSGNYTWNNSFSEGTDKAGSTSQMSTSGRMITSGASVTASATHSGPNRQAIIAASLAAAPAAPVVSSTFAVRWVK